MKWLAVTLVFLIFLSVSALVFSLLSFDADQLRPFIQREIAQALSADVLIGQVSVAWLPNPRLKINGFEIRSASGERLLIAQEAASGINLQAFLRHQLQLEEVALERAEIYFFRQRNGAWNWSATVRNHRPPLPAWTSKGFAYDFGKRRSWSLAVPSFRMHQTILHYNDRSRPPDFKFDLPNLDIHFSVPESQAPFQAEARADLPLKELSPLLLKISSQPTQAAFVTLWFGENKIHFEGRLEPGSQWKGKVEFHQLDLNQVIPKSWRHQEYPLGILTSQLEIEGEGTHPEAVKQQAAVKGVLDIRKGELKNINFLHDALERLASIPGFGKLLEGPMPDRFKKILLGNETPFDILQANAQLLEGRLFLDNIRIQHPDYILEAGGHLGLIQRDAEFRAKFVFYEPLSRYLIQKSTLMRSLANSVGRIILPFAYRGLLPSASLYLDLNYISNHLVQFGAEEITSASLHALSELTR